MIELIEHNRPAVAEPCRRFKVRRLDLFGSAATSTFDADMSDLDFTERSLRNPYFRQAIETTRQPVYEHPGQETPASPDLIFCKSPAKRIGGQCKTTLI